MRPYYLGGGKMLDGQHDLDRVDRLLVHTRKAGINYKKPTSPNSW
jgi:hypothetical protein